MQLFQQSEGTAAQRRLFFHAVDATDGISPETGLSGTGFVSENGATPAASASIVQINATNMPGRYYVVLTAAELSTLGNLEFRFKAAACAEVIARGQVVPWDPYDVTRMGLLALPNANAEAAGGLYTRGTGAGQINQGTNGLVDVNLERWVDVVVNALAGGRPDVSVGNMAANTVSALAVADDAIDGGALAQSAIDKIVAVATGTVDSSSTQTSFIDTDFSEGDNYWNGAIHEWVTGPNAGIMRRIVNFVSSSGLFTIAGGTWAWPSTPGAGDTFRLLRQLNDSHYAVNGPDDGISTNVSGNLIVTVAQWLGVAPSALISGRLDVNTQAMLTAVAQQIRDEIMPTQNAAFPDIPFSFVAASDHVTPVTGATGMGVERSINGGAFATATNSISEVSDGDYSYDASAADMNGGKIRFRFFATGGTPGAPEDVFLTIVTGGGV